MEAKANDLAWHTTLMDNRVEDPVLGGDSTAGRVRNLYTKTYKSLDQFDQVWYELRYDKRDREWRTCYVWAGILDSIINSRAAYCETHEVHEAAKVFGLQLIQEIRDNLSME